MMSIGSIECCNEDVVAALLVFLTTVLRHRLPSARFQGFGLAEAPPHHWQTQ